MKENIFSILKDLDRKEMASVLSKEFGIKKVSILINWFTNENIPEANMPRVLEIFQNAARLKFQKYNQ